MIPRFSLAKAGEKANKSQLGSGARSEEAKTALHKQLEEAYDDHQDDVAVPIGNKRHYATRQKSTKSGPGTLDLEPIAGFPRPGAPRFGGGIPSGPAGLDGKKREQEQDLYKKVVAKASNLPPDMEESRVKELFREFPALKVVEVEKIIPRGPKIPPPGRPTIAMLVYFAKDATSGDLGSAILKMNDKKYLGRGYYLHLDRFLGDVTTTAKKGHPFGGREIEKAPDKGIKPPTELGGNRNRPYNDYRPHNDHPEKRVVVVVNPPPDLETTNLIHQVVELVVRAGTEAVEAEAALMQIPEVQEEERFAWLFDQSHPLNRYYRYRIAEVVTGKPPLAKLFNHDSEWQGPRKPLEYEFAHQLGDLLPKSDVMYSDDDSDQERPKFKSSVGDSYPGRNDKGYGIMDPRNRAYLIHLFSTLPPGSLLEGEIAAFAKFAVDNATSGMDEVIDMLITNVLQPFQLSEANTKRPGARGESERKVVTAHAMNILADVLNVTSKISSTESGAAYKYRQAIGTQLVERKVFEYLAWLGQQQVGSLTDKNYTKVVNDILQFWTTNRVFDPPMLDHFDNVFNEQQRLKEQEAKQRKQAEKRKKLKGTVPRNVVGRGSSASGTEEEDRMEMDSDNNTPTIRAFDGANDERVEMTAHESGEATTAHGQGEQDEMSQDATGGEDTPMQTAAVEPEVRETAAARARRQRPEAADMFASDED